MLNQPSIQHSINWRCCNILLQKRCFQIFLFPIYHIGLEKTLRANTKIRKCFISFTNSLLNISQHTAKPNLQSQLAFTTTLILLTRLRLGVRQLNQYKFSHNFQNCINPLYTFSLGIDSLLISFCTVIISQISPSTLLDDLQSVGVNIQILQAMN